MTRVNTLALQEMLSKARGFGAFFHVTSGDHVTSDNMLKGMEMKVQNVKIDTIEKDKLQRMKIQKYEANGKKFSDAQPDDLKFPDKQLKTFLTFYQISKKEFGNKQEKMAKWLEFNHM